MKGDQIRAIYVLSICNKAKTVKGIIISVYLFETLVNEIFI